MLEILGLFKRWLSNIKGSEKNRVTLLLLVKLILIYFKKPNTPGKINDGKWIIHFSDTRSFFYSYFEIFIRDIYKLDLLKKDITILDVGSNIGLSILYYKEHYPDCQITGLEPDPKIFQILKNNIELNELSGVTLLNKAAWIKNETLFFKSDNSDGGHITSESNENSVKVEAMDIADLFHNKKYDFLKIDIEGAEFDIFNYGKTFFTKISRVFLEYHSLKNKQPALGEMISYFTTHGFRVNIVSLSPNWSPFVTESNSSMEGQYNLWFKKVS